MSAPENTTETVRQPSPSRPKPRPQTLESNPENPTTFPQTFPESGEKKVTAMEAAAAAVAALDTTAEPSDAPTSFDADETSPLPPLPPLPPNFSEPIITKPMAPTPAINTNLSGPEQNAGPPTPNRNAPPPPPPPSKPVAPVSAPGARENDIRIVDAADEPPVSLTALLEYTVNCGASDLHLSAGAPPMVRLTGDMIPIPGWPRLTGDQLKEALNTIVTPEQRERFFNEWELDFAYTIKNGHRFRGNLMIQRGEWGGVFRSIPTKIVPLDTLGMPKVLYQLAALPRGLVLVTGPTGSGKSTTLASIIDQVNRTRQGHIVTVEDPIEFVHPHRACVVNQREVGSDTKSYTGALKHVLRQDPDVILIGELRDLETISIALTAAETGHLVFATLHTQSAQDTVSRVIDVFPPGQQQQVRSQLAATLKAVVCQTLVKRTDGHGRVPACEIMIVTPAIATQIRRDETHQIPQSLQSGGRLGMHSLNQNLASLVSRGIVERSAAEEVATDLKDLANLIEGHQKRKSGTTIVSDASPINPAGLSGSSL